LLKKNRTELLQLQAVIEPLTLLTISLTMTELIKTCEVLIEELQYAHFCANKIS